MNGQTLPPAVVAARRERKRLLQALGVSLAVGLVAWAIGPSWAVAIGGTVVTFVGSLGVLRLLAARGAACDEARDHAWKDTIAGTPAPAGDREYALRPRALTVAVLLGALSVCAVVLVAPSWRSTQLGALVGLCAVALASSGLAAFLKAAILRQRIRVTDTQVIVPRSIWSREEVALDLADVTATVWGPASKPWIEIRTSFGHYERDFPMSVLGASLGREGFLELAAALASRTAKARRRQGTEV